MKLRTIATAWELSADKKFGRIGLPVWANRWWLLVAIAVGNSRAGRFRKLLHNARSGSVPVSWAGGRQIPDREAHELLKGRR